MASQSRDKKRKTISPTENTNKRPKTTAGGHDPEIFYRIKDIIGESKRKYLIDWEDNPSTGDSYEPSWEPKANANAEAVADWEARKRGKRKGRLRPSISNFPSNTPSEATASDRTILAKRTPVRSPRFLLRKSISRLPDQKNVFGSSVVDCLFAQSEAPGSELSPSIPHTVERRSERRSQHVLPFVVQVSQRPDFDPRLQYSQYISPLPAPDATAQLTSPQNRQEASVPVIFDREGIIPNSQSLPGSSSYLSPTPSETESKSSSPSGSARASSDLSYPTTLEDIVGELWQGGQVVQPEEQSGSASATPQHREQSSQETVATAKSSILSQRNPNSVRAPSSAPSAPPTNVLGTEKSCLENRVVTQPDQVLQSIESDLQEDFAATSTQRDTSTSLLSPALSQSPPSYETLLIPNHSSPPVDMSESSSALIGSTGLSLKNQLRQMRAAAAAARQGEWEAQPERPTKSPSTIPDGGPPLPVEESLLKGSLSLRAPNAAEGGHVSISSAPVVKGIVPKAMSQIIAGTVSSTVDPTPGNQEFIVPLPMDARIRDQYQEIITSYRGQVESFTHAADAQDPSLVRAMEEMIQRVKKVTVHPDLENAGTISHRQAPEYEEAKWAENSSSKFLFMRHLFDALRHQEEHIAVLARPGQTLDILEAFLKGNGIGYERPDRHSRSEGRSTDLMRVTLLPTGEEGGAFMVNRASAVIALDDTFAAEDRQVRDLREHLLNVGQQSPVLSLVVVQSAEHIERCVPDSLEDEERLQMLVSCIGQTMHEVGQLPPEAASPKAAAQEVATFLMGVGATNDAPWPLPLLGEISTMEFLTESQSSEESAGGAETRLEDLLAPQRVTISMPRTQKRSLSSEANDNGSSKRVRLTPTPTPEEGEITHVSDSVDRQSHGATGTTTTRPAAETAAAMRETDRGRLETQFLAQGEEEKRLRARLRDHVKALEAVQYRYEDLVEKYRGVRKERDEAQAAVVQADRRRELVSDELNTVKEHRSRLEGELSVARAALESSALPEVAELEKARSAALQSATEVEHLQQRLQSMVRDFEFTRAQYQEASTAAAEASTELETLRQENAVLQRKASGEAVRLREVAAAGGDERHISRIRQLELTLAEREEQLRRREEEAKTGGGRGRGVSTRAGSVPRGSPMPSASRAGSPSAVAATAGPAGGSGRVGHPLRHDQSA
ncbi:MAG: hypothetical protein M1832_002841 [Thelocarpon impressellum]|nr:MAG: hypothetical protein M1832_002841 [Thelocarpon impressellum]